VRESFVKPGGVGHRQAALELNGAVQAVLPLSGEILPPARERAQVLLVDSETALFGLTLDPRHQVLTAGTRLPFLVGLPAASSLATFLVGLAQSWKA
jgi:hypothetical protein